MMIREATLLDASAISRLVSDATRKHIAQTLSEAGTKHLLSRMDGAAIEALMSDGVRFFLAEEDGALVGLSAVKSPTHLFYLFVRTDSHRRGIGRRLWSHARDHILETCDTDMITVNSSLNAVPIYEKLGFVSDGDVTEMDDVKFQLMRWFVEDRERTAFPSHTN